MRSILRGMLLLGAISSVASDNNSNQKNAIISTNQLSNWKTFAVASGTTIATLGLFHPMTAPFVAAAYGITKLSNTYDIQIVQKETNKTK